MTEQAINYLNEIINVPSPSGYEGEAQSIFRARAEGCGLDATVDALGNVVAHVRAEGKPKLLITAHIDEIGMVVKHIDEQGFVYVVPVGGVDKLLLPGARLVARYKGRSYLGVCGRKPIHLLSEQERLRFDWEDLWVDFGFGSRRIALEHLAVGAPVVFNSEFTEMTETLVATRSADNKVGNAILVELMEELTREGVTSAFDVYLASTVQEEIGLRGALVVSCNVKPDVCLVIDAAHATDYPGTNARIHGCVKTGGGPVIAISPDTDYSLGEALAGVAERIGVSVQRDVYPNASGTEAKAMQLQCGGVRVATLSFPVRYMHSASEIFSMSDVDCLTRLIMAFVKDGIE